MILVTVVVQRARGLPIPGQPLAELVFLQEYLPAVWATHPRDPEHFYLALPSCRARGPRETRPGACRAHREESSCFLLVLASRRTYTHMRGFSFHTFGSTPCSSGWLSRI
jgi:hypothetical protein